MWLHSTRTSFCLGFRISSHLGPNGTLMATHPAFAKRAFFSQRSPVAPNCFGKRFAGWRLPAIFCTHLRHSEKASSVRGCYIPELSRGKLLKGPTAPSVSMFGWQVILKLQFYIPHVYIMFILV